MNWNNAFPIVLKLLGWALERSSLSAEAKRRFFSFVEQAAEEGAISAGLRDKFKAQLEEPAP